MSLFFIDLLNYADPAPENRYAVALREPPFMFPLGIPALAPLDEQVIVSRVTHGKV